MKRWVNILNSWLGYIWVTVVIFISIAGLMNLETLASQFIIKNGFQVSENWRGGKIKTVKTYNDYQTVIHEPVLEGWFTQTNHGFIKIDWIGKPDLPPKIIEKIDCSHDGIGDFIVNLDPVANKVKIGSVHGQNFQLADDKVLVYEGSRSIRIHFEPRR